MGKDTIILPTKLRDDERMAIAFAMRNAPPPKGKKEKETEEQVFLASCVMLFGWTPKRTREALDAMLRHIATARNGVPCKVKRVRR